LKSVLPVLELGRKLAAGGPQKQANKSRFEVLLGISRISDIEAVV